MKSSEEKEWSFAAWFQGLTVVAKGKPAGALAAAMVFIVPIGLALWLIEDELLKILAVLLLGMFGLMACFGVLAFLSVGSDD
jgi:hypothetical protein